MGVWEGKTCSHSISRVHTDLPWGVWALLTWLRSWLSHFSLPILCSFTGTLKQGGYVPPPVGQALWKLFWILLMYLLSHLLVWTHTLSCNPILFYSIRSFWFCPLGVLSHGSCVFDILHYCGCAVFLFYFKLSDTTRCSSLSLHVSYPCPRITISPRSPSSFYWNVLLETKIWVLGVLMLLVSLFQLTDKEACVN